MYFQYWISSAILNICMSYTSIVMKSIFLLLMVSAAMQTDIQGNKSKVGMYGIKCRATNLSATAYMDRYMELLRLQCSEFT